MDLGKGILLSPFSSTVLMESKKDKIAVAHPTLPYIYIYNDKLNPIDTIYALFQDSISVDSVLNATLPDSFIELNRFNPMGIIKTILDRKIKQMERIEKVFWVNDDIVGYTICQPFSDARMFVFYSISEKRELARKIDFYSDLSSPKNFLDSTRVLINKNKTIYYKTVYDKNKNNEYYHFLLYDLLPFNDSTK
jgi:hypothetical protein